MKKYNRREFFKCGGAGILITPYSKILQKDSIKYFIFDAHLHVLGDNGFIWQWNRVTTDMDDFVRYLDLCGVDKGIITSARSEVADSPSEFIAGNREVLKYTEKYKGRFVPACCVNVSFLDESLREIEDCYHKYDIVWIGELCNYAAKPRYEYNTDAFAQVVQKANELNMVLDIHTNVKEIETASALYNNSIMVFPHLGGNRLDIERRAKAVSKMKNGYMDISGSGYERVGMLEQVCKILGAEKVLFGSDFSINDPGSVIARVKNAYLSEEEKEMIFHRNIENLLKKVEKK